MWWEGLGRGGERGEWDGAKRVGLQAHGGVLITEEEIDAAFEFLDIKGKGKVGLQDLTVR
jgi:hypothetical protein